MRVNEILSRCRTDQNVLICYDDYHIYGFVYDIVNNREYKENRVGDMLVTRISAYSDSKGELFIKAVKV